MGARRLSLKGERLIELTTSELESVAGGTKVPSVDVCIYIRASIVCVPTSDCTGYYPSLNAPCTGTD